MSTQEYTITKTAGWRRYEDQDLAITVDVDASALELRWVLLRQPGSETLLLEKTRTSSGPPEALVWDNTEITGANLSATVHVAADEYDDLPAGPYYYELWDTTNDAMLAYGDAFLGFGVAPAAP